MTAMTDVYTFVVYDASRDGFKHRLGRASNAREAVSLFDVEGWKAKNAHLSEIQISRVYKNEEKLKLIYANEIELGSTRIDRVWGGFVLIAAVWVIESEEIKKAP